MADSMGGFVCSLAYYEADSMDPGLGKTLTMLALILATVTDVPANFSNATLISVFPLHRYCESWLTSNCQLSLCRSSLTGRHKSTITLSKAI